MCNASDNKVQEDLEGEDTSGALTERASFFLRGEGEVNVNAA